MNGTTYTHINLNYLDEMSYGDAELKKTMLDMLFEEVPVELEKMRRLTDEQQWEELSSVSHKMKSTVAFVGNDALTEANRQIELSAKSGSDTDSIPAWMTEVEHQFELSMPELRDAHASL